MEYFITFICFHIIADLFFLHILQQAILTVFYPESDNFLSFPSLTATRLMLLGMNNTPVHPLLQNMDSYLTKDSTFIQKKSPNPQGSRQDLLCLPRVTSSRSFLPSLSFHPGSHNGLLADLTQKSFWMTTQWA